MEFFSDLWIPIFLASIALFIASSVAWMVLPHHFGDWKKLDKESELMDAIGRWKVRPGNYMFPQVDSKADMTSEEFQTRYKKGPRGLVTLLPEPNIKLNLGLTFFFFLVTTSIIGYVTHIACPPDATGTDFMKVFRVSGTIGMLVHGSSGVLSTIWFKRRVVMDMIDGIFYGLIIGLIFGLMWPGA